jgi:predicted RNase H-like HicB family nuclease
MKYPVKLTRVEGAVMVTCPDLPEFSSVGDTEEEALREAVDGIETTLQMYMQDRRAIPVPGERWRWPSSACIRRCRSKDCARPIWAACSTCICRKSIACSICATARSWSRWRQR